MPVSKISIFGERSRKAGGSRWIGQRSASAAASPCRRSRSPITFQSRPSVGWPTGTRDRRARVDDVDAAREPVGRVHRDRADAVVAEVLLHLGDERRGRRRRASISSAVQISGRRVGEDGVDDDALDLDDLADVAAVALLRVRSFGLLDTFRKRTARRTGPDERRESSEADRTPPTRRRVHGR